MNTNSPIPGVRDRRGPFATLLRPIRALGRLVRRRALLLAAIAIPTLAFVGWRAWQQHLVWQSNRNESLAIATLKNLSSAQAQMPAWGLCDPDGNGAGGYGYFAELAGLIPVSAPDGSMLVDPPVLAREFGVVRDVLGNGTGVVERSGYYFQLFLPGSDLRWHGERVDGRRPDSLDPLFGEKAWLGYAWPVEYGRTGKRVFMVTQCGDVLASRNDITRYSGARVPDPMAGYVPEARTAGEPPGSRTAANTTGVDGQRWVMI